MDSAFSPEGPDSPTPTYPAALARRAYARVGLAFFLLFLVVQGSALLITVLLNNTWIVRAPWFSMLLSVVCIYLIGLPVLLAVLRGLPVLPPPPGEMKNGAFLCSALMVLGLGFTASMLGNYLIGILERLLGFPLVSNLDAALEGNSTLVAAFFTVILAPIGEEFIFRKLLCDRTAAYGEWQAICLSAVFFMAFHASLQQALYTLFGGGFLAFIYIRTGKLIYPILLHAVFNFFGSVPVLLLTEYAGLEEALDQFLLSPSLEVLRTYVLPLLLYALHLLLLLTLSLVGIILFFVNLKKMCRATLPSPMPYGSRASIVCGNPGFWLFLGSSFFLIVLSVLSSALQEFIP